MDKQEKKQGVLSLVNASHLELHMGVRALRREHRDPKESQVVI